MTAAYDAKELSVHSGQPLECYEFVGSYSVYRYTSSAQVLVVAGKTFQPLPIQRNNVKAGTHEDDNLDVEITVPITCDLARDYGFQTTPPKLKLTIYRVHLGTDYAVDYAIYWTGPVVSIRAINGEAKIRTPSVFSHALAGDIPTVYYQSPCNHVLYDQGCKVNKANYTVLTSLAAVDDVDIEIASSGGRPINYFTGGEISIPGTDERRMLVAHRGTATKYKMNYPFGISRVGAPISIVAGCDHGFNGHCKGRFSNSRNFGGFPFIPSINPFEEGL